MEGTYYPCASIYTMPEQTEGATVKANFGPDFAYPPTELGDGLEPKALSLVPSFEADFAVQAAAVGNRPPSVPPTTAA